VLCAAEQAKVGDDAEGFGLVGSGAWLNRRWMEGLVFGRR